MTDKEQNETKPQFPTTPAEIAACLREVSERMETCGAAMNCYGGFNGRMKMHGLEMYGAALMVDVWADEIEAEIGEAAA